MASLRKRGRVWYYRFTDADGAQQEVKGCSDRRETDGMLAAALAEAAKIRSGYIDPREPAYLRHERTPLAEHLKDFVATLAAKGGSSNHCKVSATRIVRVIAIAGFLRVSDLSLSRALDALASLRESGLSQETINHHIRAVKAFSRWLWKDKRARDHALAHLATKSADADRRRVRRALSEAESIKLIETTGNGPVVMGLNGADRLVLYALAAGTGLRRNELRSLTPERFDLSADPPTVTARAGYTKNRREAVQPIQRALADHLAPWIASKPPGRPVFEGMTKRTADMLAVDLKAAGIAPKNLAAWSTSTHYETPSSRIWCLPARRSRRARPSPGTPPPA
jgi:integrase